MQLRKKKIIPFGVDGGAMELEIEDLRSVLLRVNLLHGHKWGITLNVTISLPIRFRSTELGI